MIGNKLLTITLLLALLGIVYGAPLTETTGAPSELQAKGRLDDKSAEDATTRHTTVGMTDEKSYHETGGKTNEKNPQSGFLSNLMDNFGGSGGFKDKMHRKTSGKTMLKENTEKALELMPEEIEEQLKEKHIEAENAKLEAALQTKNSVTATQYGLPGEPTPNYGGVACGGTAVDGCSCNADYSGEGQNSINAKRYGCCAYDGSQSHCCPCPTLVSRWELDGYCNVCPPPPSPLPPAPPLAPNTCGSLSSADEFHCDLPPWMCSWEQSTHPSMDVSKEYIFDDGMYQMGKWAEVCGEAFWKANGGGLRTFPWKDIVSIPQDAVERGNKWTWEINKWTSGWRWESPGEPTNTVTSCIGGTCRKAGSTKSNLAANTMSDTCEPECTRVSDGCVFDLERYATVLVYASQVSAEHVLASMTEGGNKSYVAVELLESMQTGLENFTSQFGTNLTTPFLHAQAASVGVMAKSAASYTPSARYVPGFTYAFFTNSIKSYMSSFKSMVGGLADDAHLSVFVAKLKEQNAESADKDSVLATSTSMTKKSLRAAMLGMSSALDGIHACSKHMNKAASAFKIAVKKWKEDAWKRALELVVKGAVDLLTAPQNFADLGNPIGDISDVITVIQSVNKMALRFRSAMETMQDTTSSTDSDNIGPLSQNLIDALKKLGPRAHLDGSKLVRLAKIANTLEDDLPKMGHGYWAKYVDSTEKYYEQYTKNKDKGISKAAKSFVEQVQLQAHYGNDFVTQGMRFISALHQLTVDHAQAETNKKIEKAMSAYTTEEAQMSAASLPSRVVVSVQINTMALHLDNMARQLCQSYAYQETRLYHKCGNQENNALGHLCSRFYGSLGSSYTPFYLTPCVGNGGIDLVKSARTFLQGFANIYNNAESVTNDIVTNVWGRVASATSSPFTKFAIVNEGDQTTMKCAGHHSKAAHTATVRTSHKRSLATEAASVAASSTQQQRQAAYEQIRAANDKIQAELEKLQGDGEGGAEDDEYFTCDESVWITADAWKRFTTDSPDEPGYGQLTFQVTPEMAEKLRLTSYDEIFLRGMAAFLEGATAHEGKSFHVAITPVGQMALPSWWQMLTRVRQHEAAISHECKTYKKSDDSNLCDWTNYSYIASPSGGGQGVTYASHYYNPDDSGECSGGRPTPVFDANKPILPYKGVKQQYCTDQHYSDFDNPAEKEQDSSGSFNFASLFSTFNLTVTNGRDTWPSTMQGLNLTSIKAVHIGFWLKTNGDNTNPDQLIPDCNYAPPSPPPGQAVARQR